MSRQDGGEYVRVQINFIKCDKFVLLLAMCA